jgi:hypothetical protein
LGRIQKEKEKEKEKEEEKMDICYQLFEQAFSLGNNTQKEGASMDALMEMSSFTIKEYEKNTKTCTFDLQKWEKRLIQIVHLFEEILEQCKFPNALKECHSICIRKDLDLPEPEEEIVDERVPFLLNALGEVLYVLASGPSSYCTFPQKKKQKLLQPQEEEKEE